ncbi:DUF6316 family protein [Aurantivibrio infirmus]
MKLNRTGEQGKLPERNDRYYMKEEYWYYTTREGVDIGPFDSLDDATNGASEFIDFISAVEPGFVRTLEQYGNQAVA